MPGMTLAVEPMINLGRADVAWMVLFLLIMRIRFLLQTEIRRF